MSIPRPTFARQGGALPRRPSDLRGRRVLVVGLGTKGGGVEAVRWLVRHGARVAVTDMKSARDLASSRAALRRLPVKFHFGGHRVEDLDGVDLLLRNPAVPRESTFLARAAERRIPVVMDTTLFVRFCPAPIAGITGTRGKSTTTTVAGTILRRQKPSAVVAGNIQRSPLADLDRIRADTPVVLELSSWQLEGTAPLGWSPHWALLTCLLPDHLNRYTSYAAYRQAKEAIVQFQKASDYALLPADDPVARHFARRTPAVIHAFGEVRGSRRFPAPGIYRRGPWVWEVDAAGRQTRVLRWDALAVTGDHTKRNALAGAALARDMGASWADARAVLTTFRGLQNRLETVRVLAGRTFVNDTTATTPEAVRAALGSFPGRRIVLISGGTDKNLDYRGLARFLDQAANVRAVVLLAGSATDKLLRTMRRDQRIPPARTMSEAVRRAWQVSRAGDVILLSPGAASFELFRDEFDRGDQFRSSVAALRASAGA